MPFYKLVEPTEEGGTPTYEEVNETEIEVSEEHPTVKAARAEAKAAKDEAIKQRQRYKQLRDQLAEEDAGGSSGEAEKPKPPVTDTGSPLDIESLYATIKARLEAENAASAKQVQERDAAVGEALKKHKLPKDLAPVLQSLPITELENAAAVIAKTGLRFDSPGAGGGSTSDKPFDPADVLKRMGLVDED